ncbi:hypothetical protein [Desulfovibrio sp. UCD-KL4C]|uniref:hypothetical protein n=1 Tax=Desulfovibrio sp. UCD-KL4C TaxID=2578120 RepID=UPI0025BBA901|nr:hypothetical protein [Desulfovibrio sp. UCD-KL4C]
MDPVTLALVSSGLKLGFEAFQAAKRLSAEGYEVPGLEEFEKGTQELRDLPDLTPTKDQKAE